MTNINRLLDLYRGCRLLYDSSDFPVDFTEDMSNVIRSLSSILLECLLNPSCTISFKD